MLFSLSKVDLAKKRVENSEAKTIGGEDGWVDRHAEDPHGDEV